MDTCATVKVIPWGKGQGEYVEINQTDFDPKRHTLYEPAPPAKATTTIKLKGKRDE
jgi:hypothetical protein